MDANCFNLDLIINIVSARERRRGVTRGGRCELEFYMVAGVRDDRVMLYIL